jgi:hypothetical protein
MKLRTLLLAYALLLGHALLSQELTATWKLPAAVKPGEDITVEVTIKKGSLSGFMKYFQEVPEGSSASAIEMKSGSFTFADNGVKIVWISPPSDPEFTISYKFTPPATVTGSKTFAAKIAYIMENERKSFELPPATVMIGSGGAAEKPKTSPPVTEVKKENPPVVKTETKPEPKKEEIKKTEEPKKEITAPIVTTPVQKAPVTAAATAGKTYKVQIGAFSAKPKIDGVQDISTLVLDNGITKYFSGNFSTYEEAVKRKNEMISKGFQGAFIVSFENGKIVK